MGQGTRQIVIVGAGPAGLMAAIAAAEGATPVSAGDERVAAISAAREHDARDTITVLEQMPRPALKLLASGGGRCNLTNTASRAEFMAAFGRQGRFMAPALEAMDSAGLRQFLAELGVETHLAGEQVYPASNSARTVQAALLGRCKKLGVQILTDCRVTELLLADGRVIGVRAAGRELAADCVVLAAGGQSYPELGGAGGGYGLARQAGHTLLPPTPALVGLLTQEDWPGQAVAISIAQARVWIDMPKPPKAAHGLPASRHGWRGQAGWTGDIVFTHHGVSGPAVLNASGDVAELLAAGKPVPLRMDLTPHMPGEKWLELLDSSRRQEGAKSVASLLERHLPARLARLLCSLCGVAPAARLAELKLTGRRDLTQAITAAKLTVIGTEGLPKAMVTRSGVALREVDPHTLQSRLVAGLYLAGEVLDLDGPTGGYNLQWAFSSGWLAGKAIANRQVAIGS